MANTTDGPNRDQATYWDEQAGPKWVAMQRDLDAQLEPFGLAVMDALGLAPGADVLDVGCGAGATSLALAGRVRPGRVLGVDLSTPLLGRARERAAGIDNLRFERGDAQTFAFEPTSFDAVFSRFGVMFFADPTAAFANLRGALKPGGRVGFVCWRAMRDNPSFVLPLEAAAKFLPELPPPPPPDAPGPFGFADEQRVRGVLEGAGFEDVVVAPRDADIVVAGQGDLESAVNLSLQIGPLGRALSELDDATRASAREAVREAFGRHLRPAGVTLPSATWIVTGRRAA
ncbi:MAG: class I SAM-dependent methyltransferase [Polyangiaceae bacterium]